MYNLIYLNVQGVLMINWQQAKLLSQGKMVLRASYKTLICKIIPAVWPSAAISTHCGGYSSRVACIYIRNARCGSCIESKLTVLAAFRCTSVCIYVTLHNALVSVDRPQNFELKPCAVQGLTCQTGCAWGLAT